MAVKLLEHKADDLLEMFGEGKPTPGSGSAASLQVLVSAKLIRTVVRITSKSKFKPTYDQWLPELQKWSLEIDQRIYPELKALFQQDSDQFDEYIEAFKKWEVATDPELRKELHRQKLKRLAVATNNALAIAGLSAELGEAANFAFNYGFKDVRGDSVVALNSALAALGGCLGIVELNLTSFERDEWVWDVREEMMQLKLMHEELSKEATRCIGILEEENVENYRRAFDELLKDFRTDRWVDTASTEAGVEKLARHVQNALWINRDLIWTDEVPGKYVDVLKPEVVIEKLLGYQFEYALLGRFVADDGTEHVTAGEINKGSKVVRIASDMPDAICNFTAAHELGHALLHRELMLHRDRPLDGSNENKDIRERQADKFAAFFLMPGKLVRAYFFEMFGTERIVIDQNTVFKLGEEDPSVLRKKVRSIDGWAFYIARVESFQGRSFKSLAQIFNVSVGAMAIRLKELGLVEY